MFCQQCGQPTHEALHDGRMRPVCSSCGAVTYLDPKLAVAVLIVEDDRVLLGKRADHTREPGKWSFPAGFVERGEVVEAAAIRETLEETGLTVTLGPILSLLSSPGETVALAVYTATSFSGKLAPRDDLVELRWWSLDQLPDLAFDHDSDIINLWQSSSLRLNR
ncbi:MAG: NUDIX hydrolase [Chloroflexia bacterium]|jgi:ADP-ribose pyrophosphatase YjhB (NUDIX family)|nr:NUDIX hydrolase [Chloroflexia bacterium]